MQFVLSALLVLRFKYFARKEQDFRKVQRKVGKLVDISS